MIEVPETMDGCLTEVFEENIETRHQQMVLVFLAFLRYENLQESE